jgi:hypothetical protein
MSYTRQYHEVVSGTKTETVSVSYPASQSGGTTSRTVTVRIDIPVNINIHVDTIPFDHSVRNAENNITLLTGAVVATEAAAIISKKKSARKVGDAIVNGFFSYVRSEISQQVSEITQQTEALLVHIKSLAEACVSKKEQMTTDYHRISSRYVKLFTDLNRELALRIHQMDRPAFLFKELTNELNDRQHASGAIGASMVFHAEHTTVQVRVGSAVAKMQAACALEKITAFLAQQKDADLTIRQYMQNNSNAEILYTPICISEAITGANMTDKQTYIPCTLAAEQQRTIHSYISAQGPDSWMPVKSDDLQHLSFYFNKALIQRAPDDRLRKTIQQIANLENLQVI